VLLEGCLAVGMLLAQVMVGKGRIGDGLLMQGDGILELPLFTALPVLPLCTMIGQRGLAPAPSAEKHRVGWLKD
jgi:hypothetical protein